MSKIGKLPIQLPESVTVKIADGKIDIKGDKGELSVAIPRKVSVKKENNRLIVSRQGDDKRSRAIHGTTRAIIANAVKGVDRGWEKKLELVGTGYRAELKNQDLVLTVGFSHPVDIKAVEGIAFSVEKAVIAVSGIDRELVGQMAAKIRSIRPPEPYKGKGIRYIDEVVRRKPGKAAKAAEGGQ